jgi:magnesium-protoporphyrin O-methyltransferase
MTNAATYDERRGRLETYFNKTAVDAWAQLTSNSPVSKIRETVRQGRDEMRAVLLSWLPENMDRSVLLDAGCGTGALAVAAARRGASVVAVDIAGNLVDLARERAPADLAPGAIDFRVGDMLSADHGEFSHVAAMDSLIHYPVAEILRVLGALAGRTSGSIVFTFAPSSPLLETALIMGRLFPRSDRSPAIAPVSEARLRREIADSADFAFWRVGRTARVSRGFYTSHAMELVRR